MFYKGILMRVLPFLLTFAAGLFIASFFVTIATPKINNWRSSRVGERYREIHRLRMENHELRETSVKQRKEIEHLRRKLSKWERIETVYIDRSSEFDVPPPPAPVRPAYER